MVLVAETPEGQINHYWCRSFGENIGGRGWLPKKTLPQNTGRLTVLTPYPDRVGGDWVAPYDMINWAESWPPVLELLKHTYGSTAKVAVIPDATLQYFPETLP